MYLEVFALLGIIIALLVFFAEGKQPLLGVGAALLLIIVGFWLHADGLQIQNGHNVTTTESYTYAGANISTINITETHAPNYTEVPNTPNATIPALLGTLFIVFGLYGLVNYAGKILE